MAVSKRPIGQTLYFGNNTLVKVVADPFKCSNRIELSMLLKNFSNISYFSGSFTEFTRFFRLYAGDSDTDGVFTLSELSNGSEISHRVGSGIRSFIAASEVFQGE